MMELLLKEIRAGQEKADTNQSKTEAGDKELLAKLEADRQPVGRHSEKSRRPSETREWKRTAKLRGKKSNPSKT
jgi:hypothetical protein